MKMKIHMQEVGFQKLGVMTDPLGYIKLVCDSLVCKLRFHVSSSVQHLPGLVNALSVCYHFALVRSLDTPQVIHSYSHQHS